MKKLMILILPLCLCAEVLCVSCEKNAGESDETTFAIVIPGMNGTILTLTDAYPVYFQPMSGDGEMGKPYQFYLKDGGTVTCSMTFGVYTAGRSVNGEWEEGDRFLFEPGEVFAPESGTEYFAWGYSDGHISAEYEYEPRPAVNMGFVVISDDEYEIMTGDEHKYGTNHPMSDLAK